MFKKRKKYEITVILITPDGRGVSEESAPAFISQVFRIEKDVVFGLLSGDIIQHPRIIEKTVHSLDERNFDIIVIEKLPDGTYKWEHLLKMEQILAFRDAMKNLPYDASYESVWLEAAKIAWPEEHK